MWPTETTEGTQRTNANVKKMETETLTPRRQYVPRHSEVRNEMLALNALRAEQSRAERKKKSYRFKENGDPLTSDEWDQIRLYLALEIFLKYFVRPHTECLSPPSSWLSNWRTPNSISTIFEQFFSSIFSSSHPEQNQTIEVGRLNINWINMNFMCANNWPSVPNAYICFLHFLRLFFFSSFFFSCFVFRFDGPVSGMQRTNRAYRMTNITVRWAVSTNLVEVRLGLAHFRANQEMYDFFAAAVTFWNVEILFIIYRLTFK